MPYAPLTAALARNSSDTKDIDRPLSGSKYLEAGKSYDVTVVGVDLRELEAKNYIDLQVEDRETKASHTARLWIVDLESGKLNRMFSYFLNAVLNTTDAVDMFSDAWGSIAENAFNLFRGTTLKMTMRAGPGCTTHVTDKGTYVLVNAENGSPMANGEFASVDEATKEAKERGLKRSFPRVARYEVTSEEVASGNKEAFILALNGLREAIERADSAKA